jgi:phytol kinase
MFSLLLGIGPIFILLVLSEILWRVKLLRGEFARKVLHILIGSYVAYWPFFMSFTFIQIISVAFIVGVVVSHKLGIFHAINDVKRKTWGDILYGAGIGLTAAFTTSPWIFAVAVLHMSVADGFAGLLGSRYGKNNQYKIFGYKKSVVGTMTFVLLSYMILILFGPSHPFQTSAILVVFLPYFAAIVENVGVRGADNIFIPLLIVTTFRLF